MKNLFFLFFFLLGLANVFGQNSQTEEALFAIVEKQDSIPRAVFLDEILLPNMQVSRSNTRQVWAAMATGEQAIEQLFDIRLKFDNKTEALAFHKKYLKLNSENGVEIKKHSLKAKDVTALKLYKGSALVNSLMATYGFQVYCILFVVDNYFVKLYITCASEAKPKAFERLVAAIAKKIKN